MTGVIVAVGDITGYDDNKGLAQSAFSAVAGLLGGNNTPDPAVTAPAATRDVAADPAAARRDTGEKPAADPSADPAADSARMFDQQRRMSMMGGGGDVLGNGGNGKAQVFGAAAPPKQQPQTPGPGPRGRG